MEFCHQAVLRSHGMEQYGSLEVMEQIKWRIRPMESHGLRLLLEMRHLQPSAAPPPHAVYCLMWEQHRLLQPDS
jgi:hypothetical protein